MKMVRRTERSIPEGAVEIKIANGSLYTYRRTTTFNLLVYSGKRLRPDFHEGFTTLHHRQKAIEEYTAEASRRAARRKKEKASKNPFKVGDILECSWGYDQTNVDFYQVVSVTTKMVGIRKIADEQEPGSGGKLAMQDACLPCKDTFLGAPMRKLVQFCDNCNGPDPKAYVSISSYASAYKWDGTPQRRSCYA